MLFKVFQYPIPSSCPLDDLNRWIASHRVISVKQEIVVTEDSATLIFVVQTDNASVRQGESKGTGRRERVDYKGMLDESEFRIYDALRQARREIAEAESIPLYAIINNAQLAQMVRLKCATLHSLDAIQRGQMDELEYQQRITSLFAHAKHADDCSWRRAWLYSFSRRDDTLERGYGDTP